MTTEQEEKQEFIIYELFNLCRSLDDRVARLDYNINAKNDEFVTIWYLSIIGYTQIKVCITGDSLGCIAIDVIRKIIY